MKILTNKKIEKTMSKLPPKFEVALREKYHRGTNKEDRMEFPFDHFIADFVNEVAYRQNAGIDGNWIEFAGQWKITEEDHTQMLAAMTRAGYSPELEQW